MTLPCAWTLAVLAEERQRERPSYDAPHPSTFLDLHMLVLLGGRERTDAEYSALFADAGFALRRVLLLPGGPWSVVEGVRVETTLTGP